MKLKLLIKSVKGKICTLVGKDLICSISFHSVKIQLIAFVSLGKDFSVKIYLFWLKFDWLMGEDDKHNP